MYIDFIILYDTNNMCRVENIIISLTTIHAVERKRKKKEALYP